MTRHERIDIGGAVNRVEGPAKVTGQARYAAEYKVENLLYGVVVSSAIAKGRITAIDDAAARSVPGVVDVLTHANRPRTAFFDRSFADVIGVPGSPFRPLEDDTIMFSGQPVAVVLADTFEAARFAASLVQVSYETEPHNIDFDISLAEKFLPSKKRSLFQAPKTRGDPDTAFAQAPLKITSEYRLATEFHNPMEMHATTVEWHGGGKITVYDKTQGSQGVLAYLASSLGFAKKSIRVVNAYIGGAFGAGLRPVYNVYLAAMAAKKLERSVRIVLTRQQMFTHGHRPQAIYQVKLATDASGKLQALMGDATTSTSRFEQNMENVVTWGMMNYACPNASGQYSVAPRDTYTSSDMRAPGAATGMTLFEMAIDEMAYAAKLDPLSFRLLNYSDVDALNGTPFTSKALREAFTAGARAFGWEKRSLAPRSMREGRELVGWGCATGLWEALFQKTSARAKLSANGDLEIASAATDIGPGTYTLMAQMAAASLGLPLEQISVRLGDSDLPASPLQGGSWTAASTGLAVQLACQAVAKQLLKAADKLDGKPLKEAKGVEDIVFADGRIALKADPTQQVAITQVMRAADLSTIEAEETAAPGVSDMVSMMRKSRNTHSAIFAEVKVDEELDLVRVTRVVNAVAAGRIINPKTARSQVIGGVVMGIGMALHEEGCADKTLGRWMNHNFAEYHVPVSTDVGEIEVLFVDEPDAEVNPLGVKGLGEIGVVGTAAAVANAIYHATGKRVRSLPITIDKLLACPPDVLTEAG